MRSICLLHVICFLFSMVALAQGARGMQLESNATTLTVTGIGSTMVENNSTFIQLTVQNRARKAQDAQRLTATAMQRVVSVLTSFNVSELQTESILLQPVYNYTDSPPRLIDFESTETISYKVAPELAGQTLDEAVGAGANSIDSVQSTSGKDQFNNAHNTALEMAARDAEAKAQLVADALAVCLMNPVSINVEPNSGPMPTPTLFAAASLQSDMQESRVAPTIIPGKTEVSATIVIVYSQAPCTPTPVG